MTYDDNSPSSEAAKERDELDAAAIAAVAGAMRPRQREAIHREASRPGTSPHETARQQLEHSIAENLNTDRTVPFWEATGPQLTEALTAVTDVDHQTASYLVGASLHALILGRQDTTPDHVLRLAERAASWHAGRIEEKGSQE